ncbi:hypothetical protein VdG2_05329 [Verticillium dahliae VDG2]|nr:hypothetical protein VdG2_05329 [Verticillium dahliae VDG2]
MLWVRTLPQAGLPQGSPLSPILFLFFNADLVQRKIDCYGGAIAFVDDFTAWVAGPTTQDNRTGIKTIIEEALAWERRSGATFEADKTVVIHFTRWAKRADSEPFTIKGQTVEPKHHVKILGVIMDIGLRYKEHIARAATKGLEAAMELKRLRGLTPATARQLFTATVAPVVDYASNVWRHRCKDRVAAAVNRVQKVGAQAIIGAFTTVATSVAEAEAHIASAQELFLRKGIKLWTDLHTLPETNPFRKLIKRMRKFRRFHRSPFYELATALNNTLMEDLETINPFTLPPWTERVETVTEWDNDAPSTRADEDATVRIAVSSSARNELVGVGGVIEMPGLILKAFSFTHGMRTEQNPFSGELVAAAYALRFLPRVREQRVMLLTSNKAAVLTLRNPRQKSGQEYVGCIYEDVDRLRADGNTITAVWQPSSLEDDLLKRAKGEARKASREGATPEKRFPKMRSTTLNAARLKLRVERRLPDNVGKLSKEIDTALAGKHTRELYDNLSWTEASMLAQLRTGMARLNASLFRIRAVSSAQCACRYASETVERFVLRCTRWATQRAEILLRPDTQRDNISFHLGGKTTSDGDDWKPDMKAVRATIRFAKATGRLENA